MIKRVRHIGIVTSNLSKSLFFYKDLLGFQLKVEAIEEGSYISKMLGIEAVKVETVKLLSPNGEDIIELLFFFNPKNCQKKDKFNQLTTVGLTHFALTVNDVDYLYNKLRENGVKFINSPVVTQNNFAKVAFCQDPNNVYLELVEEL